MTYYALLLFFLVEYVRPGNFVPGLDALKLNLLVPVTAIIGTFVRKSPVSNRDLMNEPNTIAMIAFLGVLCMSTLFAVVTSYAFDVTKNVFAYMLIYLVLVRQLGDVARIKGVFATLIGVHVLAIGLSPDIFADSSGRASVNAGAFLGDGNDFALSVNIILPLCLFLLQESRKKLGQLLWLGTTILLLLAIVATKSRGGTIALVVVGLYFWMRSRRKLATAACVLAGALTVVVAAPPAYFSRMSTISDTEESSAQGRINAWKTAASMAADNPLLGAGAGHFPSAYGARKGGRWMTAHSIYFLLLGELGIPGISVLLFLIIYNLVGNRRLQRDLKQFDPDRTLTASNLLASTSAAMVAFAVAGTFLSAAYYPHLYVISGLAAAARYVVRQEIAALSVAGTASPEQLPAAPVLVTHGVISPTWQPRPAQVSRVGSTTRFSTKIS
jgi:putative inorganic carbon (HCO3(-)) transporter